MRAALPPKQRELRIVATNLGVGMILALAMKADLFAMLAQPTAPWSTFGWTQWSGTAWVRHAATRSGERADLGRQRPKGGLTCPSSPLAARALQPLRLNA